MRTITIVAISQMMPWLMTVEPLPPLAALSTITLYTGYELLVESSICTFVRTPLNDIENGTGYLLDAVAVFVYNQKSTVFAPDISVFIYEPPSK